MNVKNDISTISRTRLLGFVSREVDEWEGPADSVEASASLVSLLRESSSTDVRGVVAELHQKRREALCRGLLRAGLAAALVATAGVVMSAGPHGTGSIAGSLPEWAEILGAGAFWVGGAAGLTNVALTRASRHHLQLQAEQVAWWAARVPHPPPGGPEPGFRSL